MSSTLLNQLEIDYGLFGQISVHSTLEFYTRLGRRETNDVPHHKRNSELTALMYILWSPFLIRSGNVTIVLLHECFSTKI